MNDKNLDSLYHFIQKSNFSSDLDKKRLKEKYDVYKKTKKKLFWNVLLLIAHLFIVIFYVFLYVFNPLKKEFLDNFFMFKYFGICLLFILAGLLFRRFEITFFGTVANFLGIVYLIIHYLI